MQDCPLLPALLNIVPSMSMKYLQSSITVFTARCIGLLQLEKEHQEIKYPTATI